MNEEEDYYFDENGMLVMTEAFHRKRGFCCGNHCKHCPYPKVDQVEQAMPAGRQVEKVETG